MDILTEEDIVHYSEVFVVNEFKKRCFANSDVHALKFGDVVDFLVDGFAADIVSQCAQCTSAVSQCAHCNSSVNAVI